MKISHLSLIFIIIMLPISLAMSSLIQSQIDTINLQTSYNTKLNASTYDAVRAFQINTVHNRYSSVSNSKIRDIEASINTFYNSLSNNEETTREELNDYVPALLYTLYDGYYIYSKYDNVYPENNGNPVLDEETLRKDEYTNFGLKPYIYYSCRYKNGNKDFVVNYTLDNAITLYGNFGSGYETLSGYLINPNAVNIKCDYSNINGDIRNLAIDYGTNTTNMVEIKPEILKEHLIYSITNSENGKTEYFEDDFEYVIRDGKKIYREPKQNKYFWYDNYTKTYINDSTTVNYAQTRTKAGHLYSTSAFDYFKEAKEFSKKVIEKTKGITQKHAIDENGETIKLVINTNEDIGFTVDTGNDEIFIADVDNDPLLSGSTFNENRIAVIRRSIESNLMSAIANYNNLSSNNYEFSMPVLNDDDWYKITNNVCVASFLQGLAIGHKYYNNYCIIVNGSNEEVITSNDIYITTKKEGSNYYEYHEPGCHELFEKINRPDGYLLENAISGTGNTSAYSGLSFLRQTVRIAEGNYLYFYPQMRGGQNEYNENEAKTYIQQCYHCIVNASDTYSADEMISGILLEKNDDWDDEQKKLTVTERNNLNQIRTQYITALARERYCLYQANVDSFNT